MSSSVLNEKEAQEMVAEAKILFKESGENIINSLNESLKRKAVQQCLPESCTIQLVEIAKRKIFNSFKQLKKKSDRNSLRSCRDNQAEKGWNQNKKENR